MGYIKTFEEASDDQPSPEENASAFRREPGLSHPGVSPIEEKMEVLGASIDRVDAAVQGMFDKISPVLGPDMSDTAGPLEKKALDSELSAIAQTLDDKIQWLNRIARQIEAHVNRVQL